MNPLKLIHERVARCLEVRADLRKGRYAKVAYARMLCVWIARELGFHRCDIANYWRNSPNSVYYAWRSVQDCLDSELHRSVQAHTLKRAISRELGVDKHHQNKEDEEMRKGHCWYDSDDNPHVTLEQCQVQELVRLGFDTDDARKMVENASQVLNILNVTPKSRLGGRKLNGAKRKSRTRPEQPNLSVVTEDPLKSGPPF